MIDGMTTAPSRASITERIRVELGRRDETRAEMCRHLGMKPSTFSEKMRGLHSFTTDELHLIGRYLGVPYADFFPADEDDEVALADA